MGPRRDYWEGRPVLVTGHTGFKGAWLGAWLQRLGARVTGYALAPPTEPNLFTLAGLDGILDSHIGDIRDGDAFTRVLNSSAAEVVFHLAAQPLVRTGYAQPLETFATNVMGLCQVLDAIRYQPSVRTVIVVTSDKCYRNHEWPWPYRETDPLGGHDPYSASKACQELAAAAWHRAYLMGRGIRLATVRAGNVIGGGDFADDRLVPDLVRAAAAGRAATLRNPSALRPWQHVLDPLSGYLMLAEQLAAPGAPDGAAWNFGPDSAEARTVGAIADGFAAHWGPSATWISEGGDHPPEARLLQVDSSLARADLGWRPRWGVDAALARTVAWYHAWHRGGDCRAALERDLAAYEAA